jgi:hypothetical protein
MAEPTKEQRLKALLAQEPEPRKPAEGPHVVASKYETKDLGETVGYRKCNRVRCEEFGNMHPILVRGEETLVHSVDGNGQVKDQVENSTIRHFPVDEADTRCLACGDVVGFVMGEGLLASVGNPDFGVSNDREAIVQVRQAKRLPLPEWAQREIAKANLAVQQAVKDDL